MPKKATLPTNVAVRVAGHTFPPFSVLTLNVRRVFMAGHKTMVEGNTVWGGVGGVLFVQDNNNNILRCYWVPLTVQMEESVKFPGDINTFPTVTQRKACVRLENKLRK